MFIIDIIQVPSHVLLGIPHGTATPPQPLLLTPMGEACLRKDLTALHEILEKTGYKDDEGIANEVFLLSTKFHYSYSSIDNLCFSMSNTLWLLPKVLSAQPSIINLLPLFFSTLGER